MTTPEPLAVVSMVSTTKYGTVTTGKVTHPAEQLADGTVIYLRGHDWHDASPTIRATFREQTS